MSDPPVRPAAQSAARCQLLVGAATEIAAPLVEMLERANVPHRLVDDADALSSDVADVVLLDMALQGATDLAQRLIREVPDLPVVLIAASGQIGAAVQAVKRGASDFVRRPLDEDELVFVVDKALRAADARAERPPPSIRSDSPILGDSGPIKAMLDKLRKAARGIATVLVRGESGAGKELVARQLHTLSPRSDGPFVKVHCGALPDNLLESELFGYEKGAFTGATARKPGRVELAEGGTLFLDEIGDISSAVQVKLLRVLQDREYERLGGTKTLAADVRFVAATHKNLERMVENGEFREDLFYRLNVVRLLVPPLRDRPDDVAQLATRFVDESARANRRPEMHLSDDAIALLQSYRWPGNVRQLQNVIERLVVLTEGQQIGTSDVQAELDEDQPRGPGSIRVPATPATTSKLITVEELEVALRIAERRALQKALARASGNRNAAARILGVSRRKLYYMLQDHDLT